MKPNPKDTTDSRSLSSAFAELETIVAEFENNQVNLESGIPKFKRGLELAKFLKSRLGEIENEIIKIKDEFKDEETTIQITDTEV